ncbi:MAG: endonuclease MutS2 [Chlorobi bacterium]|nr:endonuclease MutS2 [Chlorobiota bacterium]
MIYPSNFEQKLGFDIIRNLIAENCISDMGKTFVSNIRFSAKANIINTLLTQSQEFTNILIFGESFPSSNFFDLRKELIRVKLPGTYIEQESLFDLKSSLLAIKNILGFFNKSEEQNFIELKKLSENIYVPKEIISGCEKIIDDKGEIRDNASQELSEIRHKLNSKARQVLRETKKAFAQAKKSGWVPDNTDMTIRNGRTVIPLRASDKRAIGGFIHDESSTGQTVFVEPAVSFELSNQIRELENEERREIIKILIDFTNDVRPFINELISAYRYLGIIDFIRAKALFSIKIKADIPKFSNGDGFDIKNAVHPLLWLTHSKNNKEVVPLDLKLDNENRILLISGPNAGGKSVCLKTTGLLQYMFQCGLPIPVSPNSEMRVFKNLFIDIGDEQSLENDLSTYSSHLLNMKYFLRHANAETLFMIDEFGTGTEPQLGGSIAEATLESLNKKESFGLITTHYSNLKIAADKIPGLFNGAMLFDSKEMKPLYRLQMGKPGSSFAFEIAKKIGFPSYVLNRAKKKSGGKHVRFDQQLQQLETDKMMLQKQKQKVETTDDQLSRTVEKYTNLLTELEKSKKQFIADAKEEALRIIESSNKVVERTIREIKEAQADKAKTKEIREQLEKSKDALREIKNEREKIKEKNEKIKEKRGKTQDKDTEAANDKITEGTSGLAPGDHVRVKGTDMLGELHSISGDEAFVNVNDIKLKTSLRKLVRAKKPKTKTKLLKSSFSGIAKDINQKAANFRLSLDLRGMRVDEAMSELQRYVDDAMILSIKEVSILHGKGNGILRPVIREYLRSVDEILSFGDAPLDQGGAGITKVFFDR